MHDRYIWMARHNEKIAHFFFLGHLGSLRKSQYKKKNFMYVMTTRCLFIVLSTMKQKRKPSHITSIYHCRAEKYR
jgi:hypothetical protein